MMRARIAVALVMLVCCAQLSVACSTPSCNFLTGLSSQVSSPACAGDLKNFFNSVETLSGNLEQKQYGMAVQTLARSVHDLSSAVTDCNVVALKTKLQQLVNALSKGNITISDQSVKILMESADVYNDVYALAQDAKAKNYAAMGNDLKTLVSKVQTVSGCTSEACTVVAGLLDTVSLVLEDAGPCEQALETTFGAMKTSLNAWSQGDYVTGVTQLAASLQDLQNSLQQCGLTQLAQLVDSEARALNLSHVNAGGAASVVVNDVQIATDIANLAAAAASKNWPSMGNALGALILKLQQSSCQSNMCSVVIALMQESQIVIQDMGQCRNELNAAETSFSQAVSAFKSKQFISTAKALAAGLDDLAQGVTSCHLEELAQVLTTESAKLKLANLSNVDNDVALLVNGADVYDDIYAAITAASTNNWGQFGTKVGALVNTLQLTAHCDSPMCQVMEALLESMAVVGADLSGQCATDLDAGWNDLHSAVTALSQHSWRTGVSGLAGALHNVASAINDCNLSKLALIIQKTAAQLGGSNVTSGLSGELQILIDGADVYNDLYAIGKSAEAKDYSAMGQDLGSLLTHIGTFKCNSPVCVILNGLIQELQLVVTNLKTCEADLSVVYSDFETMSSQFHGHHYEDALKTLAGALNKAAAAFGDCQIPELVQVLERQAQQLGITQVKVLDTGIMIASGGAEIYQELFNAVGDFQSKNYNGFGKNLGAALLKFMNMQSKFGCSNHGDICMLVQGAMQGLDLMSNIKECEADLETTKDDFEEAIEDLRDSRDHDRLRDGLKAMGNTLHSLVQSISACHVEELVELLGKLATKLLGPLGWIGWLEEAFKVVIEGVDIADEVMEIVNGYEAQPRNWLVIGYNIAKLVLKLV